MDISKCGKQISIEEYAQIEQSDNFAFSVEINMDNQTVIVNTVDGHIGDPDRNDSNFRSETYNLNDLINSVQQEVIVREERSPETEIDLTENREEKILNEIAAATGYTSSQLNVLPKDIKADLIAEYDRSGGQISTSTFAHEIASILNVEPPKQEISQPVANVKTQKSEKDESTKTIEELVEGNANSIDGIINNEKPKQEKIKEVSRFSLKDLHSDKYTPRSNKSEEQEQQKNDRGRDI